jgi:hypothetical protein
MDNWKSFLQGFKGRNTETEGVREREKEKERERGWKMDGGRGERMRQPQRSKKEEDGK